MRYRSDQREYWGEYHAGKGWNCLHSGSFPVIRTDHVSHGFPLFSPEKAPFTAHGIVHILGLYIFYTGDRFMAEPDIAVEVRTAEVRLFPWWLLLLWGILTFVIGLMLLLTPVITMELFALFFGAYWLVGGVFVLASLAVDRTNKGIKILLSVINIVAGILFLQYPLFSTIFASLFFVVFIAFWAVFVGAVHLYHGLTSHDAGNSIVGIISIIFGILILVKPLLAVVLLPFVAGGFCIVSGLAMLYVSYVTKTA
jgi:uncharacterized membrane protein HdeD (DUF308 family)